MVPCRYAQFGQISVKLDVFSFGVILFQLVSGREAILGTSEQLQSLVNSDLFYHYYETYYVHCQKLFIGFIWNMPSLKMYWREVMQKRSSNV